MLKRFLQRKSTPDAPTPDAPRAKTGTRSSEKAVYRLTIQPTGDVVGAPENKALLDAALDADVLFPHNCCAGDCGSCMCRVVEGEVEELMDTGHLIDDDEREEGWILGCQTLPRSDVVVEIPDV